jgi:hypothetical protein
VRNIAIIDWVVDLHQICNFWLCSLHTELPHNRTTLNAQAICLAFLKTLFLSGTQSLKDFVKSFRCLALTSVSTETYIDDRSEFKSSRSTTTNGLGVTVPNLPWRSTHPSTNRDRRALTSHWATLGRHCKLFVTLRLERRKLIQPENIYSRAN